MPTAAQIRADKLRREIYFAEAMVEKFQELLQKAAGVQSIVVDGQNVSLSDLETKWTFWKKELARLKGAKPRIAVLKFGGV